MINIKATVLGIAEAIGALNSAKEDLDNAINIYSREAMEAFIEDLSDYPPETGANNPPAPYWIRGTGLATNNQGTNISRQSEKLIASWVIAQDSKIDESIISGFNTAGYAPWVHGSNYQSGVHARRNWPKIKEVSERLGIPVVAIERPPGYSPVQTEHPIDFANLTPIVRNPIMEIIERLRQKLAG